VDGRGSGIAIIVGGALLAVGSFLTWTSQEPFNYHGFSDELSRHGWFTLVAGATLVVFGLMQFMGRPLSILIGWLAFAVGAVIAALNFYDILTNDLWGPPGIGIWLVLAGVVISVFGLVAARSAV
jgi:hypothetical protein